MYVKCIQFCGQPAAIACDGVCSKAWGMNSRPRVQLSDNVDDYEYLSDNELGEAPVDPGIYEGDCAKPVGDGQYLNKWCARECERCVFAPFGKDLKVLPDFSVRISNRA